MRIVLQDKTFQLVHMMCRPAFKHSVSHYVVDTWIKDIYSFYLIDYLNIEILFILFE